VAIRCPKCGKDGDNDAPIDALGRVTVALLWYVDQDTGLVEEMDEDGPYSDLAQQIKHIEPSVYSCSNCGNEWPF
jgi:hypothetical protein